MTACKGWLFKICKYSISISYNEEDANIFQTAFMVEDQMTVSDNSFGIPNKLALYNETSSRDQVSY